MFAAGGEEPGDVGQRPIDLLTYADALQALASHNALIYSVWRGLGDEDWQELKTNRGTVDTSREKLQKTINALELLREEIRAMQEQKQRHPLEGKISNILRELGKARIELTTASLNAEATAIGRTKQFLTSITMCRTHLYTAYRLFPS